MDPQTLSPSPSYPYPYFVPGTPSTGYGHTITDSNAKGSKLLGLVGGLVAVVVVAAIVAFLAMWWRKRRNHAHGTPIDITRTNGEAKISPILSSPTDGTDVLLGVRGIQPRNKRFNRTDIERITKNYEREIGKGGFGKVYHGHLQDGTEVAVKVLRDPSSAVKQFCAEAELLERIHHVNLVTLIGYCYEPENMALVFEFMSGGDLQAKFSERNQHPLSWEARLRISVDTALGLEYLHSGCRPPIIHRDIKPANILLDENGNAKIADFGLSRFYTTHSQAWTKLAFTLGYADPECPIQEEVRINEKSDVYAFGVVLLQLLTGQPVFTHMRSNHQAHGGGVEHIIDWVRPMVESGDILAIIDTRLQRELVNVNSAWQFLEIALKCVKRAGRERPRMSEVVVALNACYAEGVVNGSYYTNSTQGLSMVSPPNPR